MKIKNFKIEYLLLIIPFLIIIIGKIIFGDSTIDIHLHDTMFVIANTQISTLLFMGCIILFAMHWYLRKLKVNNRLVLLLHVFITVLFLIFILYIANFHRSRQANIFRLTNQDKIFVFVFLLFVLIQVVFVIYFLITAVKRAKGRDLPKISSVLFRPESLLILFPVINFLILNISFHNFSQASSPSALTAYNDIFLLFISGNDFISWLLIMLFSYTAHFYLRKAGIWKKSFCLAHIIISLIILELIFFTSNFATSVVPGWHTTIFTPNAFNEGLPNYSGSSNWLFIGIQLLFIIYAFRMFYKRIMLNDVLEDERSVP